MARRRGLIDQIADAVVDTAFDRAEDFVEKVREQQVRSVPEERLRTASTCAACQQAYSVENMQMLDPRNQYGICRKCWAFLWESGKLRLRAIAEKTIHNATGTAPQAAPVPKRVPPWEVLGISSDATEEDVKKAFRREAALCHPDAIPAGTPTAERDRLKKRYLDLVNAKDAMLKVRREPTG
jgi:hypothetical protein